MRSLDNLRRQIQGLQQADVAAVELPHTPEQKRQSLIEFLAGPKGCVKAFGQDDERCQPDYLNRLSYRELLLVFQQVMKALATQRDASGESDWFKALPYETKIQILRGGFNAADAARLKKQWEATQCGR